MQRIFKGVSIAIHAVVIGAVLGAQLLDAGLLPIPRSALAFEPVSLAKDVPLPPAPRRAAPAARSVDPYAAPITVPEGVQPETDVPHVQPSDTNRVADIENGVGIAGDTGAGTAAPPPPPPPPQQPPIRLHQGMQAPVKIVNVDPIYPTLAREARRQGLVILEAVIGVTGRVESVRVLKGDSLLDPAAVSAVQQWRFAPARLNGEIVPVVMTVTVNFRLQ